MKATIPNELYAFLAEFVFKETGIQYVEKDYYRLDSRILSLISFIEVNSPEELFTVLKGGMSGDLKQKVIDLCTNNETYFFRDSKPFEDFANVIVKGLDANALNKYEVWSCACSTGQEPLSMLMSVLENVPEFPIQKISLTATDISSEALAKAKGGVYTNLDVQRGLPVQMLVKYFEQVEGNHWKVKSSLHDAIHFDFFNLLTQVQTKKFDLIFCRNVLIYQDRENKAKILEMLTGALRPGGLLLFGAGESLVGIESELQKETIGSSMYFRKPGLNAKAA